MMISYFKNLMIMFYKFLNSNNVAKLEYQYSSKLIFPFVKHSDADFFNVKSLFIEKFEEPFVLGKNDNSVIDIKKEYEEL